MNDVLVALHSLSTSAEFFIFVLYDSVIEYLFQNRTGVPTVNFLYMISNRIFRLGYDYTVADFIAPFMKNLASKMQLMYLVA